MLIICLLAIIVLTVWFFTKSDRKGSLIEEQYRDQILVPKFNEENESCAEATIKPEITELELADMDDKLTEKEVEALDLEFNKQLKEKNKQKMVKREIIPYVRKFVSTHINHNAYPKAVNFNKDAIKALQLIIKQEKNIDIEIKELEQTVLVHFDRQNTELFKGLFLKHNPELIKGYNDNRNYTPGSDIKTFCDFDYNLNPDLWIRAYLKTFGNNFNNLKIFFTMLDRENLYFDIFQDINNTIIEEELKQAYKDLINQNNDTNYDSFWATEQLSYLVVLLNKCYEEMKIENLAMSYKEAMYSGHNVGSQITIQDIDKMGGLEFEQFLTILFKEIGYQVELTKASGDQGADLIVERIGERTVIQAKCYSQAVTNKAIQEVVASKAHYQCSKAMVITNNYFTKSAVELACSNEVELWDREKLEEVLHRKMIYL